MFWGDLGTLWNVLGHSGVILGRCAGIRGNLGTFLDDLGTLWGVLG